MNRPLRIGLGIVVAILAIIGVGIGYTLLVGSRPDIGNPDLATVKTTLVADWQTPQQSRADLVAGLTDEFAATDIRAELDQLGIGDPVLIRLTFTADSHASAVAVEDGKTKPIGDGTYRLLDNHTMVLKTGDCEVRSQFRLNGETLTFGVIGSCPTQDTDLTLGVLLRSAPFNRLASSSPTP